MRQSIQINCKEFLSLLLKILIPCGWFINKNSETETYSLYTGYRIHGKRKGGYVQKCCIPLAGSVNHAESAMQ